MKTPVMTQRETLKSSQIDAFLTDSQRLGCEAVLSFTRQGKWRIFTAQIHDFTEESVTLNLSEDATEAKAYQPVGICVQVDHFKYLFETSIAQVNGRHIVVERPDTVERMQRRAYERHPVPENLKVKTLFWHRGYLDDSDKKPTEQYWQGRLINLSAGGAQIAVDMDQKEHFCSGQLLGLQFTPMSYQRPLLLESHVRYFIDEPENAQFLVGIEFLGLEASAEGRETLARLIEVIDTYEQMNRKNGIS